MEGYYTEAYKNAKSSDEKSEIGKAANKNGYV
jgi:hypothetical protein